MSQFLVEQLRNSADQESELMAAILECCGELGYPGTSVADVCRRSGWSARDFDRHFGGKEECFVVAYEAIGIQLQEGLRRALESGGSRRARLEDMLHEAAAAAAWSPGATRALLLEVHSAGRPGAVGRLELMDRLARQLDRARGLRSRHSEPTTTSTFLVGAVEGCFADALIRDDLSGLRARVLELAEMVDAALS
jgi:AcrR family transcriptional regulator